MLDLTVSFESPACVSFSTQTLQRQQEQTMMNQVKEKQLSYQFRDLEKISNKAQFGTW